ncbi:hypothetical protein BU26DRAFT_285574 [Trematosphaeria pertusa]|uniref:Uncharacterized protein n=1 Tax=Trematosphaeria pertusa TaxID=390896 RepID=A0A6A6IMS0_9PLEO|nr:uncharacterized protein BU26DRAFT_285574 [Trematosphaeria pertusa]KAF2251529.1 hypothetical protein BU26DRAFT_285574 [Trematosphaeria pertusa]
MVLKLLTLLAIGVTAVAATLAPLHPRDTADGNTCTFHASIVETCASTTPVTYANIPSIRKSSQLLEAIQIHLYKAPVPRALSRPSD